MLPDLLLESSADGAGSALSAEAVSLQHDRP